MLFCSCPIYIELMTRFAFLFSLADFHFLKSIVYLQVSPMLFCLIMYVVLSRDAGDMERLGKDNKNVPIANTSRLATEQQRTTEPPGTWLYPPLFWISLILNFPAAALRCRPCRRCPPSPGGAAGGSALPAAGGNSGPRRGSARRTPAPRARSRGDGAEVGQRLVCWIRPWWTG